MTQPFYSGIQLIKADATSFIPLTTHDYIFIHAYSGQLVLRTSHIIRNVAEGESFFFHNEGDWTLQAVEDASIVMLDFDTRFVGHYSYLACRIPLNARFRSEMPIGSDPILRSFFDFQQISLPEICQNSEYAPLQTKILLTLLLERLPDEERGYFLGVVANGYMRLRSIVQNYYKTKRIEELAELCHMSMSAFERNFKKEFGMSPLQWINLRKAEYLFEKIAFTNRPYAELADEMNFSSVAYLSNFIKKYYNRSPDQIRKREAESR